MNQAESKNLRKWFVALCTALIMLTNVWAGNAISGLGRVDKVWIEERVKVGDNNGIIIHVKYKVKNAVGEDCLLRANFFTTDGARIVPDTKAPREYRNNDGHAIVAKNFSPKYPTTDYADSKLSIPYWVLSLKENNENKMKFFVVVRCGGEEIARSEWVPFSLRLGKAK